MRLVQLASLAVFALGGVFIWTPWLRHLPPANALIALLSVHVFRVLVLFAISARQQGFPLSDAALTEIVGGNLAGAVIAFIAIVALYRRSRLRIPLSWLVVLETIVDLAVAIHRRIIEPLNTEPTGPLYFVLAFFVPLIIVTLPLLVWQLLARRNETL
jgi:hypothetical protein